MGYHLKDSLVTMPLRTIALYIAVFPRQIVFGSAENDKIGLKSCIVIDISSMKEFYKCFLLIISNFAKDKIKEVINIDVTSYESCNYSFIMRDTNAVVMAVTINEEAVSQFCLNYPQFNELLHLISEVIFISLNLKSHHMDFLSFVSKHELTEIVELRNPSKVESFCQKLKAPFDSDLLILRTVLLYHLDLIVIFKKLKGFVNIQFLPNQIDFLN